MLCTNKFANNCLLKSVTMSEYALLFASIHTRTYTSVCGQASLFKAEAMSEYAMIFMQACSRQLHAGTFNAVDNQFFSQSVFVLGQLF